MATVDYLEIAKKALEKFHEQQAEAPGEPPRPLPHCPRCASFALYRKDNVGNYQCQTCSLRDISEEVARRIQ